MRHVLRKALFTAVSGLIFATGTAFADSSTSNSGSTTSILDFAANGLLATQTGGSTTSGQVGWTPRLALTPTIGIRGVLEAALYKGTFDNKFIAADLQALGSFNLGSFFGEAGPGYQMWIGEGVKGMLVAANLGYRPSNRILGLVDRLVVGGTRTVTGDAGITEVKLGIGIQL